MKSAWLRVGVMGMLAVALSSGIDPWIDALSGAFVPADIAQDAAAARLFRDRIDPYSPAIREQQTNLIGLPVAAAFPHFPHPPFSLIVSLPLAFTSFRVGAALWFAFTLALLLVLAALLAVGDGSGRPARADVWRFGALLLVWPPVLYCLEKGQWSMLLAVLLTLSWRSTVRGDLRGGAIWGGAAAAVKVFPVLLGPFFLLRSLRAVSWFVLTGLVLTAVPLVWIGSGAFAGFIRESRLNMPYWESFPLVMFSIHGAIARLFIGGQGARPLFHAPLLAAAIDVLAVGALFAALVWITLRATPCKAAQSLVFCAWLIVLPVLNPQSLGHNGIMLALPIVVLARTLSVAGLQWQRWAWAASIVLVSIPKQTVWRFAPPPVEPLAGLVVSSLPTWGALLLFLVAISLARHVIAGTAADGRSGKIMGLPTSRFAGATADPSGAGRPVHAG